MIHMIQTIWFLIKDSRVKLILPLPLAALIVIITFLKRADKAVGYLDDCPYNYQNSSARLINRRQMSTSLHWILVAK